VPSEDPPLINRSVDLESKEDDAGHIEAELPLDTAQKRALIEMEIAQGCRPAPIARLPAVVGCDHKPSFGSRARTPWQSLPTPWGILRSDGRSADVVAVALTDASSRSRSTIRRFSILTPPWHKPRGKEFDPFVGRGPARDNNGHSAAPSLRDCGFENTAGAVVIRQAMDDDTRSSWWAALSTSKSWSPRLSQGGERGARIMTNLALSEKRTLMCRRGTRLQRPARNRADGSRDRTVDDHSPNGGSTAAVVTSVPRYCGVRLRCCRVAHSEWRVGKRGHAKAAA